MSTGILDRETHVRHEQRVSIDHPERPHLVLVPTGAAAVRVARARQPKMRLTKFGRLVVSLFVSVVLVALVTAFAGSLASASAEVELITVRAGQTLSGIAAEHLPELATRDAVVELQIFNNLSTDQIHAGQTLRIPAP